MRQEQGEIKREAENGGNFTSSLEGAGVAERNSPRDAGAGPIVPSFTRDFRPVWPTGWKAEDASLQPAGTTMFGGVTAERRHKKGDLSTTVKIIADAPMMQAVIMMPGNPMFANADGGKLGRIKGRKAILKNEDGNSSVKIVVNRTLLVRIEGSRVSEADLRAFASWIDCAKITAPLQAVPGIWIDGSHRWKNAPGSSARSIHCPHSPPPDGGGKGII